jgi:hypothetical protein
VKSIRGRCEGSHILSRSALFSDVGILLEKEMNPGKSRIVPDPPGFECRTQQPLIKVIWSMVCCDSLSTDVDTGGGDAPITVVRTHDVNPGANGNGAYRDSLTSLSETGTRCRVDRD